MTGDDREITDEVDDMARLFVSRFMETTLTPIVWTEALARATGFVFSPMPEDEFRKLMEILCRVAIKRHRLARQVDKDLQGGLN